MFEDDPNCQPSISAVLESTILGSPDYITGITPLTNIVKCLSVVNYNKHTNFVVSNSNNVLYRITEKNGETLVTQVATLGGPNDDMNCLGIALKDDIIYISSNNYNVIYKIDINNNFSISNFISIDNPIALCIDHATNTMYVTQNGIGGVVSKIDLTSSTPTAINLTLNFYEPFNDEFFGIAIRNSADLWISARNTGVLLCDLLNNNFTNVVFDMNNFTCPTNLLLVQSQTVEMLYVVDTVGNALYIVFLGCGYDIKMLISNFLSYPYGVAVDSDNEYLYTGTTDNPYMFKIHLTISN